jgi:hypothetical protein
LVGRAVVAFQFRFASSQLEKERKKRG